MLDTRSAVTAAPIPLAPTDGALTPRESVGFRWAAPPGARRFELRVAAASAPGTPLVDLSDLPAAEATVADALPAGPCLWWVRQSGGAWSPAAAFVAGTPADLEAEASAGPPEAAGAVVPVIPPEPVWPHAEGPALDGAPPLDWSAVPGFGTPTRAQEETVGVAPPRPLAPLGGEVVDAATVALRWAGVPGAVGYDIELSPDAAFSEAVLALDAGAAIEIALPGLVPVAGPRLFWRVRARTAAGPSAWSRRGRFYPALGAPVDRFRAERDAALVAFRKRRDYDRQTATDALDAVPLHERPEDAAETGTFVAVALVMGMTVLAVLGVLVLSLAVG